MPSAECSGLHWRPIVIVITISISTESFYAAGFGSKHRQPSHENCIMSKQPSKDRILEAVAFADEDGVVPPVIAQLAAEGYQRGDVMVTAPAHPVLTRTSSTLTPTLTLTLVPSSKP